MLHTYNYWATVTSNHIALNAKCKNKNILNITSVCLTYTFITNLYQIIKTHYRTTTTILFDLDIQITQLLTMDTLIASDLFQVIEPVVLLARTSGFLPVTYEKQGCKYLFQRSLKYVLYNYTLALVLSKFLKYNTQSSTQDFTLFSADINDWSL